MKFLKLGKHTINPSAIAYINWEFRRNDGKVVRIIFTSHTAEVPSCIELKIGSPEAKALDLYFNNPNNVTDLMPQTEEARQWQYYLERGGAMSYQEWLTTYNRHRELMEGANVSGYLSDRRLDYACELEAKLLY